MSLDDIQSDECPTVCDFCSARLMAEANGVGWQLLVFNCVLCKKSFCPHLESEKAKLTCFDCVHDAPKTN